MCSPIEIAERGFMLGTSGKNYDPDTKNVPLPAVRVFLRFLGYVYIACEVRWGSEGAIRRVPMSHRAGT